MNTVNSITLAMVLSLTTVAARASSVLPLTYDESYARFDVLARQSQQIDRSIQYEVIPVPGFVNENRHQSGIQLFYAPATKAAKKLVVVSSGIHGVEAPAGSFISQKLLQYCLKKVDRSETGIVLLHNMNPWGYQNGRRTNANNVDLNRNCFDHRNPFPGPNLANPTYDWLREVFEPSRPYSYVPVFNYPVGIIRELISRGVPIRQLEETVSMALSGQYRHPKGIYYGGNESQHECSSVQKRLLTIGSRYSSALHLDIHTGLGKFGINQIMANEEISDSDFGIFQRLFPPIANSPYEVVRSTGKNSTLVTHGDFNRSLCEMVPSLRPCLAATAEIGALSGITTIAALINENATYQNQAIQSKQREQSVQVLRDVFTPASDPKWVAAVRRNAEPFCDAIMEFTR